MESNGYTVETLKPLLRVEAGNGSYVGQQDLITAAFEISRYLSTAARRTTASLGKVAMAVAVNDIGHRLRPRGAMDSANAWAIAVIGAATSSLSNADNEYKSIAINTKSRIGGVIESASDPNWGQFWKEVRQIQTPVSFELDVETSRATRLWEALLRFSFNDSKAYLGRISTLEVKAVQEIGSNLLRTTNGSLISIQDAIQGGDARGFSVPIIESRSPQFSEDKVEREVPAKVGTSGNSHLVQVWFGTNRKPVAESNVNSAYTNKLSNELYSGICYVNVPKMTEVTTGVSRFISAWLHRAPAVGKSTIAGYFRFPSKDMFIANLNRQLLQNAPERNALLYVHGFNVSFEAAAKTVAEFSVAIRHSGPTLLYSWASKGRIGAYRHDKRVNDASRPSLVEFLSSLSKDANLDSIDVVAHSMGNRLFLRALVDWFKSAGPKIPPLRNVYLGAPDISSSEFKAGSSIYSLLGNKLTLYLSNTDTALLASKIFMNRNTRAGLVPPVTVASNIDTIEASAIDLTALGHSYITEAAALRSDVFLIQDGEPDPNRRPNLDSVPVTTGGPGSPKYYWRFRS